MGNPAPVTQIAVDHAKLQRMLGSPELSWLVERIRSRLERGEPIDGTVTLVGASPAQRKAVARLLGHSPGRGTSLSVPLPAVAVELWRAAAAPSLTAAVEALGGPVRDLAAERSKGLQRWGDALATIRSSELSRLAWYREWADSVSRDGTVTRLIRQGHSDVIAQAVAVLERLPEDAEPGSIGLAALAAEVAGNDQALSDGPLADLVVSALAAREGVQVPVGHEAVRALWTAVGVVTDDLASQVLVLNVRAVGEPVGRWLTEAAQAGQPFRLTLRQLTTAPVLPWALEIYVCSGRALLQAAADELGTSCPALVCTEGEPSVACLRLLHAVVRSGSAVHWHGDFSWAGLRGTATAIRRLQAQPWRMSASDYRAALSASASPHPAVAGPRSLGMSPLTGHTEPSPWDPRLAELMRVTGRGVSEDRVVTALLADLADRARETGLAS